MRGFDETISTLRAESAAGLEQTRVEMEIFSATNAGEQLGVLNATLSDQFSAMIAHIQDLANNHSETLAANTLLAAREATFDVAATIRAEMSAAMEASEADLEALRSDMTHGDTMQDKRLEELAAELRTEIGNSENASALAVTALQQSASTDLGKFRCNFLIVLVFLTQRFDCIEAAMLRVHSYVLDNVNMLNSSLSLLVSTMTVENNEHAEQRWSKLDAQMHEWKGDVALRVAAVNESAERRWVSIGAAIDNAMLLVEENISQLVTVDQDFAVAIVKLGEETAAVRSFVSAELLAVGVEMQKEASQLSTLVRENADAAEIALLKVVDTAATKAIETRQIIDSVREIAESAVSQIGILSITLAEGDSMVSQMMSNALDAQVKELRLWSQQQLHTATEQVQSDLSERILHADERIREVIRQQALAAADSLSQTTSEQSAALSETRQVLSASIISAAVETQHVAAEHASEMVQQQIQAAKTELYSSFDSSIKNNISSLRASLETEIEELDGKITGKLTEMYCLLSRYFFHKCR
jgi:hypothetical protein